MNPLDLDGVRQNIFRSGLPPHQDHKLDHQAFAKLALCLTTPKLANKPGYAEYMLVPMP